MYTALSHLNTAPHGKDCSLFSTHTCHRDLLQLSTYLCYSTMSHQCSKDFTFSHCSVHSRHFLKVCWVCCSQNCCAAQYHLALVSSCRLHIPAFLFNLCPLCHHVPHLHHHHLGNNFHVKIFISNRRNGKHIIFQQVRFVICVHHILCNLCSCLHVGLLVD